MWTNDRFCETGKTTHIEGILLKHPLVKALVMGGEGKKVPFLSIELADDGKQALDTLWPMIEEMEQQDVRGDWGRCFC